MYNYILIYNFFLQNKFLISDTAQIIYLFNMYC